MVMEQGRIVERGTHAQLYAARGRYYDLYTRQHGVEENLFLAPAKAMRLSQTGTVLAERMGMSKPVTHYGFCGEKCVNS